jgi:hypothetical protein
MDLSGLSHKPLAPIRCADQHILVPKVLIWTNASPMYELHIILNDLPFLHVVRAQQINCLSVPPGAKIRGRVVSDPSDEHTEIA